MTDQQNALGNHEKAVIVEVCLLALPLELPKTAQAFFTLWRESNFVMLLCVALQKTTVIKQKLWNAENANPSINIISRSDVVDVIVFQLIAFATLAVRFLELLP